MLLQCSLFCSCNLISVPNSYQYLGDPSVLYALVDAISSSSKDADLNLAQTKVVLRAVISGADKPLPPLNWPSLLSPLLRKYSGEENKMHFCNTAYFKASLEQLISYIANACNSVILMNNLMTWFEC